MAVIVLNNLGELRARLKDKKIVFCSGSFDLAHAGHVLFLEDCKNLGDVLVVGVGPDEAIRKDKGEARPILNAHLRVRLIDSLKPVDYTFVVSPPEKHSLDPLKKILEQLSPNIYVINSDASDIPYREQMMKQFDNNTKMIILQRHSPDEFDNVSTTQIVEKIKRLTG